AGRRPLEPKPVDLGLLAEWAAAELHEAEPGREAEWQVQPGLLAQGDETLLRQLMQRLLHNAWTFTSAGEPVRVAIEGERMGDRLQLRIRDSGSGFDMRYAGKLFTPFHRLHGPEEGGGHGMGLAIAKRIIDRHGGNIRAESAPGQGSTFHLELPAAAPDAATEATA